MTNPAYRIHTRRLVLRCWDPRDAPLLQEAIVANLEHLRPWMPWAHDEPGDLEARILWLRERRSRFDADRDYTYGILDRGETRVLGGCGLHTRAGERALEIGYWIDRAHLNQGLATEAAAALTRVAFEVHQVSRVEFHCAPGNLRSAAVPRKLGFVHEATLRQREVAPHGPPRDTMIWTLLAAEYPQSPAASAEIEAFDVLGRKLI